jgi:hypothetical protein
MRLAVRIYIRNNKMEIIIFLVVFTVIAIFFIGFRIRKRSRKKDQAFRYFRYAAEKLNSLEAQKGRLFIDPKLTGKIDDLDIYCRLLIEAERFHDNFFLLMNVMYPFYQDVTFSLKLEYAFTRVRNVMGKRDFQVGDPQFDDEMLIKSSNPEVLFSFLNYTTRKGILSLAVDSNYMQLNEREFEIRKKIKEFAGEKGFLNQLESMIEIINTVKDISDIKKKLIQNIYNDPLNDVREKNLYMLVSRCEISEEVITMLNNLLKSGSIEIQLMAALQLGKKGMDHIGSILDKKIKISADRQLKIVKAFTAKEYEGTVLFLKKLYLAAGNDTIKLEILKAFQSIEDESVSPFLVPELNKDTSDLTPVIIATLGTCGTKDAIEPIYKKAKASMNPFLRNAAQKAIGQIKSRITDGDTGWLSMYELSEEEGSLSISDEASEGALSKSEE